MIDQDPEVPDEARGEQLVAGEDADLDVAIECCFGEVRRGDEGRPLVDDDRLGVEDALGPVGLERSRVVVDGGLRRAWPVLGSRSGVRSCADQLLGWGVVAVPPLDVEHDPYLQPGDRRPSGRRVT